MMKKTEKKTNLNTNLEEVSKEDQIIALLQEILEEIKKLKKQNMSAVELFGK